MTTDALLNEDPVDEQVDNDGDGQLNEDPANRIDEDGDGLIDEDPVELIDNDLDGLIDEDGPDPQFDNDGDGRLNEDGLYTLFDDDWDANSTKTQSTESTMMATDSSTKIRRFLSTAKA